MQKTEDWRCVQSFIQAAHSGSFTAAAQQLGLTTAAVSKNVSTLEKSLGIRLFNRTTRTLNLTDEGRLFAAQAAEAFELLQNAAENVRLAAGQDSAGSVRISLPNTVGRLFVVPHLAEWQKRHPLIRLDLDFDNRPVDFVKAGCDLAVRGGSIPDSSMVSRELAEMPLCLAASPDYLSRYGTPRFSDGLSAHRLIVRRLGTDQLMPWHFKNADGGIRTYLPAAPALILSEPEALLEATLAGCGIAELPLYLAQAHLKTGRLKTVLSKQHHKGSARLVLQYPHRALLAPRVRAAAEFLAEKIKAGMAER